MSTLVSCSALSVALFVAMLAGLELGRRWGRRRLMQDPDGARIGLGAIEGAVFGLMGLLLAFTFSGASARFDHRRDLIVREANAIGTAWLRLDLLEPYSRSELRAEFRAYLDARLDAYRNVDDPPAALAALERASRNQKRIWEIAANAARSGGTAPIGPVLLPALNEMFDVASERLLALRMHPPTAIYGMLAVLLILCALMAGIGMAPGRERNWVHMLGFAGIMSAALFLILDLEFPRRGLIRVDSFDRALVELRQSMGEPPGP